MAVGVRAAGREKMLTDAGEKDKLNECRQRRKDESIRIMTERG